MELLYGIGIACMLIGSFIGGYAFRAKTEQPTIVQVGNDRPLAAKPKSRSVNFKHPLAGSPDIEESEEIAVGMKQFKSPEGLYEIQKPATSEPKERD